MIKVIRSNGKNFCVIVLEQTKSLTFYRRFQSDLRFEIEDNQKFRWQQCAEMPQKYFKRDQTFIPKTTAISEPLWT